jgi:hypothetical protein
VSEKAFSKNQRALIPEYLLVGMKAFVAEEIDL